MNAVLITSSILIVLTAALRPLLRGRIDPRAQYALWLLTVLRLLVPLELAPSAYSALALLDRAEEPARVMEAIGQTTVPIPGMSYADAYDQALHEYQQNQAVKTGFTDLDEVELRAQKLLEQNLTLADLAAKYAKPLWLGGAAVMGLWFLLVNLRLRRKLRAALPVEADCPLPVRVSPELPSPCLCGAFRPAVYVTPAALADPDRLRHVLAHELTHYRHVDHWWALARCLCLCVYWFDPLVWWAAAMSRQDCELACDAGAIRRLGEAERIPYGRTLVAMIAEGRNPLLQAATTMTGGRRRVRERVRLIARKPKTAAALALAAVMIVGLAIGCTFTGAPEGPAASQAPELPSSDALTADTLRERLMDVPEELKPTVTASASETKAGVNDIALVSYWWDVPAEWDSEQSSWLLDVHRWQRSLIDKRGWPQISDEPTQLIAQDEEFYYVLEWPGNPRFQMEDSEPFTAAYQAIRAFAVERVLETGGIEADIRAVLAGSPPTEAQKAVQTAVDRLMAAPGIGLTLAPAGTSRVYAYPATPSEDYFANCLSDLATDFQWEEAPYSTSSAQDALRVSSEDGTVSLLLSDGSYLMLVEQDGETNCYKGQYLYDENGPLAYDGLRQWFDVVELSTQRSTSVPDRGQSHQEIVEEWIGGYEGAFLKCAPGSAFACTYVQAKDVRADSHSWMEEADLDEYAQSRGYAGDDYGKTWFTFNYCLVFVPVDQTTDGFFWAGNTEYYKGDDAPEGALIYSRVGYMELIDGNWICEGVGTGW